MKHALNHHHIRCVANSNEDGANGRIVFDILFMTHFVRGPSTACARIDADRAMISNGAARTHKKKADHTLSAAHSALAFLPFDAAAARRTSAMTM